ncbi:MAG TPA: DoxX family protein [Herbaspirillum sp.]
MIEGLSASKDRLSAAAARFASPGLHWLALLGLCAAYLQGGIVKAVDFQGAVGEMAHFGLTPALPFAVLVIVLELGASALILTGYYRWIGALALAIFTLMATFMANRFWNAAPPERFMMENGFFEHLGLVGGFLLVAWHDLKSRGARNFS